MKFVFFIVVCSSALWCVGTGTVTSAVTVSGNIGTETIPAEIPLMLDGDDFKSVVAQVTVATSWITNLPSGLTALISEVQSGDHPHNVKLTVSGTPTAGSTSPLTIEIPAENTNGGKVTVALRNDVRFNIGRGSYNGAVTAPVTISGVVNVEITPVEIPLMLEGDDFKNVVAQVTVATSWITNLPDGLTALISEVQSDDHPHNVKLTVSGTPTTGSSSLLTIIIPAENTNTGAKDVAPRTDVNFNIAYQASVTSAVTISGTVNSAITPTEIPLMLDGDSFKSVVAQVTVATSWIANLPAGLTALVSFVEGGGSPHNVKLTVSGTPTVVSSSSLTIIIPADNTNTGAKSVAPRVDVKFDIKEEETKEGSSSLIRVPLMLLTTFFILFITNL